MELAVLGPVEVRSGGRAAALGPPKQRALLAALGLHLGRAVTAEALADLVWVDRPPAAVAASLQSYVAGLRRVLEPGRATRAPASVLATVPTGYVLRLPPGASDAGRFTDVVTRVHRRLAGNVPGLDAVQLGEELDAALGLWRGDPYADLGDAPAAVAERARLEELRLVAVEDRALCRLALGEHATVAADLEPLARAHPLREPLWAVLVQALAGAGRQSDALDALRRLRAALADELGIDPGPAVRELALAVLRQENAPPAPKASPAPAPPETGLPLVGRKRELAALHGLVEAAASGRPQLALVVGEPGIGKTRLAEELATRAAGLGALVLRGRCSQDEGAPPLWPWTGVLRDLAAALQVDALAAGELSPLLHGSDGANPAEGSDAARFLAWDAVARALVSASDRRPLLVQLDDLHWADASSLRLLRHLVETVDRGRITVLGTRRNAPEPTGALAAVGEAFARRGALRVELSGLDAADVGALVHHASGRVPDEAEARALRERTEGNPFFLVELVRLHADGDGRDVPVAVADVVAARIAALPEATREVLRTAAVAGRRVDLGLLAAVGGRSEDAVLDDLDAALAAGLVGEEGIDRFRFAHALVRDAVYAGMSGTRRARRHAAVAEALETAGRVPEAARHWLAAGPAHVARAWRAAEAAADQAVALHGHEEAAGLLAAALEAQAADPSATPGDRYRLWTARVAACRWSGDREGLDAAVMAAVGIAEEMGDVELMARAAIGTIEGSVWPPRPYGRVHEGLVATLHRVLERLPAEDRELRCRAMLALAAELAFAADALAEREALAAEGFATARSLGDPGLLVWACAAANVATWRPATIDTRHAAAAEALAAAEASGDERGAALAATLYAVSAQERGDLAAMWAAIDRARALSEAHRLAVPLVVLGLLEAPWLAMQGRFADSEAAFARAAELMRRTSMPQQREGPAGVLVLRVLEGRAADVVPWLADVVDASAMPVEVALLAVMIRAGRVEQARARYARHGIPEIVDDWQALMQLAFTAEVAHALGLRDVAAAAYERMAPYPGRVASAGSGAALGPVDAFLALAAAVVGEAGLATRHADDAERLCEQWGIAAVGQWFRVLREQHGF